jgi:hypothetical protein
VHQSIGLCVKNAPKLTNARLKFKFFPGVIFPNPVEKGEEMIGKWMEVGRKGREK